MTIEEWHADILVTQDLVKNCLQAQFPALTPIQKIQYIGEGWDNKVFLINEKIIFRFPRRKAAVALIERENVVLSHLPPFQNIEIPVPVYIGCPTSDYPYPFQGYKRIEGISAHQAALSDEDRAASIIDFADFLKQLHRIDAAQATLMGAEVQRFDKNIIDKTISTLQERVAKIITQNSCNINDEVFQQEIATVNKLTFADKDLCLVHADLDCRHLLFDKKKLKGIIDWGDVCIGHKAVDLAMVWAFYPPDCHTQFFKIYGAVDIATWQYARFLGIYGAFTLLLYGKDIDDSLLVAEATRSIVGINKNLLND